MLDAGEAQVRFSYIWFFLIPQGSLVATSTRVAIQPHIAVARQSNRQNAVHITFQHQLDSSHETSPWIGVRHTRMIDGFHSER